MLNKILILVTLCVYCSGNEPVFRNDYKFNKEANGWFKLHVVPMKWEDARFMCYYEGAVLASPLNNQLQAAIINFLKDHKSIAEAVFSGVSTAFASGIYQSVEGTDLKDMSIRWTENEPVHVDGCLVFYSNNGTMGSKYCSKFSYYPFLCYKENKNVRMVRNECGTIDNGYRRVKRSTKCYKYHPEPTNWNEAYKNCHAEGGRLAVDYNIQLNQFTDQKTEAVYIGYKYFDGHWYDIAGNPMKSHSMELSFSNSCGAQTWSGTVTNKYCYDKYPFLCEKFADNIV